MSEIKSVPSINCNIYATRPALTADDARERIARSKQTGRQWASRPLPDAAIW